MYSVRLSVTELYFLGEMMNAQYIDYSYIAALPEIQRQYEVYRLKALSSLEAKGLGEVGFTGSIKLDNALEALLKPVFSGEEAFLTTDQRYIFHLLGEDVVKAVLNGQEITLSKVSDADIKAMLKDKDAFVQAAGVGTLYRERHYTANELSDEENISEAIKFLRGR